MPLGRPRPLPLPQCPPFKTPRRPARPSAPAQERPGPRSIERLPAPPLGEELRRVELREVGAQRAGQPARLGGLRVPEERDLARGDLEHLDGVGLPGAAQQRGSAARLAHAQLVLAIGLHARTAAALSSSRSPWKTRPSMTIAGTSST